MSFKRSIKPLLVLFLLVFFCLIYTGTQDLRHLSLSPDNVNHGDRTSNAPGPGGCPPQPRWTPVQNKLEYVGKMANASLPFLELDSPETRELLDAKTINCSQPWMTIKTSGQLGSCAMQTIYLYNLKLKYKLQAGMNMPMYDQLRDVFPYMHHQPLPHECRLQLKEMEYIKPGLIPKKLAKNNGKPGIAIEPDHHHLKYLWYLRKVIIEEFRIADHTLKEARGVLANLLDQWRRQVNEIRKDNCSEPTKVVAVHIRRGDKAREVLSRFHATLPPASYFHNAFESARKMFGAVAFVIITDDLEWSQQNVLAYHPDAVMQSEFGHRHVDLAIMSLCDHVIMAVSNYGFLAGWLAGGKIFYPESTFKGEEKKFHFDRENAKIYDHFIPVPYYHG